MPHENLTFFKKILIYFDFSRTIKLTFGEFIRFTILQELGY